MRGTQHTPSQVKYDGTEEVLLVESHRREGKDGYVCFWEWPAEFGKRTGSSFYCWQNHSHTVVFWTRCTTICHGRSWSDTVMPSGTCLTTTGDLTQFNIPHSPSLFLSVSFFSPQAQREVEAVDRRSTQRQQRRCVPCTRSPPFSSFCSRFNIRQDFGFLTSSFRRPPDHGKGATVHRLLSSVRSWQIKPQCTSF